MKRIQFSKEEIDFMIEQYTTNKMSTLQLGQYFNCSRATIEKRLKQNNIILQRKFKYEDLTGKKYGHLTVVKENKERYARDIAKTKKPHRYWWCKCDCGNPELIQVESSHLKNGHTTSCGCIRSLAEQKITQILTDNNISFKSEYSFDDLRGVGNGILRYDFAIFDDKQNLLYLIEYHGKQHYIQDGGWNTKEKFALRQANDSIKEKYAKEHNIPLIIIPHTVKPKNITLNYLLLQEKNI